jgi:fumarylacetoacetase
MNVGDLLGSGTISGYDAGTYGSLLEACQGGKADIQLEGGETRKFLQDGDTIVIRGVCKGNEHELVGFGDCVGKILPALST